MLASVILAAGESRRMGSPKATLPYPTTEATPGKVTFLDHLLSISRHPKVGCHRVVLGANAEKIRKRVNLKDDWIAFNPDWKQGQLSSIHAAIRSLPAGATDGIIVFLVDHPLITDAVVSLLVEKFYASRAPVVIPTLNGKRGHPVIFGASTYDELLAAPLDTGARQVVWAHQTDLLEVPTTEEGVILNLNDPDAMRHIAGGA